MKFDIPTTEKSIIKVIGVGGGGGNAVKYMFEQGIKGVDFAICNTDRQALEDSPISIKIGLGPNLTDGRGAGSRPEIGKQACIESIEDIKKFLEDNTKMLFITAGLGGGTGTGAAPIIAKAAKEMDILTVAIVTLPFSFEGMARERQALEGLTELKKSVDAILVISNNKLFDIFGDLKLTQAFANANEILNTAAKGIAEIITVPGQVNVDFEDVNTVMRDSGVALMGFAEVSGEDRARKSIENAINSPLLKDSDIRGAQNILLNISTSSGHEISMMEFQEITQYVQEEAGRGTNMIWGHCCDEELDDKLRITLIATGFMEDRQDSSKSKPKKQVVSLEPEFEEEDGITISDTFETKSQVVEFDSPSQSEPFFSEEEEEDHEDVEQQRRKYRALRREPLNATSLDNPRTIEELEKRPAYDRHNINFEDVEEDPIDVHNSEIISIDDDSMPRIGKSNTYINRHQD